MDFAKLVHAARGGSLSRRSFLAAAAALGVGSEEALAELPRGLVSLPAHLQRIWQRPPEAVSESIAITMAFSFFEHDGVLDMWKPKTALGCQAYELYRKGESFLQIATRP